MRSCGIEICGSGTKSFTPGTPATIVCISLTLARSTSRSSPYSLMATCAWTPESMAEIKWAKRLLDAGDDAGDVGHRLADVVEHLLAAAPALGIEADDELGHVDADDVLVEFGPAGPGDESLDALDLLQPPLDHLGDLLGPLQRRSRRQEHVELGHAFVEGRHEVALHARHGDSAHDDRRHGGNQDRLRHAQAEADDPGRQPFQPPQHEALLLAVGDAGIGQQPIGQHRRYGQGNHQRGQDRDDIGDSQGREQPPLHPAQGKQRNEHQHDNQRAEDDGVANLRTGLKHDQQGRLRIGALTVLAQPAEDVFHVHDGVVHQFADGHGQAASVIVLIDMSNHLNTSPVTTMDSGMAVSVMNVVRKLSRKMKRMMATRMPPSRKAAMTFSMARSMNFFC